MKKVLFLITLLLSLEGFSQPMNASVYLENTKFNPMTGFSFSVTMENHMEIGGFYQESLLLERIIHAGDTKVKNLPASHEQHFYGILINYPLHDHGPLSFTLNVRTGVINHETFTVNPTVLTDLRVFEKLEIGAGVGVRCFTPTLLGSIKFIINQRSHFPRYKNK